MRTLEEWIKYTLAFCPEGESVSKFLATAMRQEREPAAHLLDVHWADNKLTVSHEDGHHETVTKIEVNPAGELVVWLEA